MNKPYVSQAAYEDTGIVLMARLVDDERDLIKQSAVGSIQLIVWDLDDTSTAIATVNLAAADVIFDTLNTSADSAWSLDAIGCNFLYKTLAAHLPSGGKTYRFQVRVTPASGSDLIFAYEVPTIETYGS